MQSDEQQLVVYLTFKRFIDEPFVNKLINKFTYGKSLIKIREIKKHVEEKKINVQNPKEALLLYTLFNARKKSHSWGLLNKLIDSMDLGKFKDNAKTYYKELNEVLVELDLPKAEINDKFLEVYYQFIVEPVEKKQLEERHHQRQSTT
jgi:hypothetical protein